MSNTIVISSDKKSMFLNSGNSRIGHLEIDAQGLLMSIVGDSFVNIESSEEYHDELKDLLKKENIVAEYNISDLGKQHVITLSYNQDNRSVAIIGITDIDVNMTDSQTSMPLEGLNVKGQGVKMVKTQASRIPVISDKVLFVRSEKVKSSARSKKKSTKFLRFYLLEA